MLTKPALIAAVLALCPAVVLAQDAHAVLEQAADAIDSTPSFSAKFAIPSSGSGMLQATMPSGYGRFITRLGFDPAARVYRVTGEVKERGDTNRFDYIGSASSITWIDHKGKKVLERTPAAAIGNGTSVYRFAAALDSIVAAQPYAHELDAQDITLEDRQTIERVECDVVLIRFDTAETRAIGGMKLPNRRWFFGVDDHLPRRVESFNNPTPDAPISLDISAVVVFSDLDTSWTATDDQFTLNTPDGYTRQIMPGARPAPVITTPTPKPTPQPVRPRLPAAPDYTLTGPAIGEVSLDSQRGEITVLYFFGTWCIPCRDFNPLMSDLADDFADDPVSVFGVAVRSDPDAAAKVVADGNFHWPLLIDDHAVHRDFEVKVFPTITVISPDGKLITSRRLQRDTPPEDTVADIKAAIQSYLDNPDN